MAIEKCQKIRYTFIIIRLFDAIVKSFYVKESYMKDKYSFLTSRELIPTGWMRRQLEIEAKGLAGNLDKVWRDVRDSKWIGGTAEGWERVPYWLDGFIPLAFLLGDEDMEARAKKYVDAIISRQEADGWICPSGDTPRDQYDIWAVHLISKVLTVWYDCTGDERIPDVLYRTMKNFYELARSGGVRVYDWGKFRWFEGLIALKYLKKWYPDETWFDEMAAFLRDTGADYDSFHDAWKRPINQWTYHTHVVNLAMMLKSEALMSEFTDEKYRDLARTRYDILMEHNGMPVGTFTGDECLSGRSAIQGVELCAVVELMYSFEWLYAVTGDRKWAELLEKVAFNALPAATTDDMWAHQYDQMTNQISASPFPGRSLFRTNSSDAHIFGLEPNYGCCTANFGQGWPKLALSAFMRAGDGFVSSVPLPCEVKSEFRGVPVRISLETDYPFRNSFVYRVKAGKKTGMKLKVRVPSFARGVIVNGEMIAKRTMLVFDGFGEEEKVIRVEYSTDAKLVPYTGGLFTAERGSLVYSLPIDYSPEKREYSRNGVDRKFPYCDYHLKPTGKWSYAFANRTLEASESEAGEIPFSAKTPSATLKASLVGIGWGLEDGFRDVAARLPESRKPVGEAEEVTLIPYGAAKLRMTAMPIAGGRKD